MKPWETLSRRVILDYSKFLTVEEHAVRLPDGQVISDWPWVVTPDFVNVVAVTEEGRYLCFRQTKYGIDGTALAPVGGFMEPGEDPLAAARRELLEETGYEGPDWIPLGSYRVDANRGAGMAYFFLVRGVQCTTEAMADDLEEQELLLLGRGEMEEALMAGQFKVLPWAAIVALALRIGED